MLEVAAPETEINMANTLYFCGRREGQLFLYSRFAIEERHSQGLFKKIPQQEKEGKTQKNYVFEAHTHIDTYSVSAISVTKLRRVK